MFFIVFFLPIIVQKTPSNFYKLFGKSKIKGANKAPASGSSNQSTSSNAGNFLNNTPSKRGRNDDDNEDHQDQKRVDTKPTPDKMAAAAASGIGADGSGGLTDEELSFMTEDIHLDGAATTYAAATKKQLVDPNLVVYFHKTDQKREPCQKGSFDKFMDLVLETMRSLDKKYSVDL